ncbi:phenol hydroxylase P5 protein [Pseudonocardia sulfidoxydans NBRC 16205]|uniref:Phenol hydroxylase P5 protein n=1 Tax=Pseudonocardia sulfidoxydans NBRC 16205 TaxID=1223511 RepID=A0A511DPY9_9PSEU|nr:2Fe-2S iron-sulfur cluster binding domain-containing protein [Pseudonocardia sulfidoxydans]GEL26902.1 phenol hydroxylase P5 protein [Pseudonocardia sulfidoxydans NBRC 16205]
MTELGRLRGITVHPFGARIPVEPGERLLDAILRAGRYVPFGCNHGGCGTCVATVVSGDVEQDPATLTTLDARSREEGRVLLCSSQLRSSDAEVDVGDTGIVESEFAGAGSVDTTTTVTDVLRPAAGLFLLRLRPPESWAPRPGQFVQLALPGGDAWRSYSVASRAESSTVDLVIRRVEGGVFNTALDGLRPGDDVRVRGPFGAFTVRTSHRAKLFVGGGAGIGPLRPMILQTLERGDDAPVHLVHTGRDESDLAFREEFIALAEKFDHFTYDPLVTVGVTPGVRGADLAADAVDQHHSARTLRRSEAYLCGPDAFVDRLADHLITNGLRDRYLAADRFTASSGSTLGVAPPQDRKSS